MGWMHLIQLACGASQVSHSCTVKRWIANLEKKQHSKLQSVRSTEGMLLHCIT